MSVKYILKDNWYLFLPKLPAGLYAEKTKLIWFLSSSSDMYTGAQVHSGVIANICLLI